MGNEQGVDFSASKEFYKQWLTLTAAATAASLQNNFEILCKITQEQFMLVGAYFTPGEQQSIHTEISQAIKHLNAVRNLANDRQTGLVVRSQESKAIQHINNARMYLTGAMAAHNMLIGSVHEKKKMRLFKV